MRGFFDGGRELLSSFDWTVKTKMRDRIKPRRSVLESLEARQLLTGNGTEELENDTVDSQPAVQDPSVVAAPHFEITAGNEGRHFYVDTVPDAEGKPTALMRTMEGPNRTQWIAGELELSLFVDDAIVDQFRVKVTFPPQELLDDLQAHRRDRAAQLLTSLASGQSVEDTLNLLDADGKFSDLKAEAASFEPVVEDVPFNPDDPDVDWSVDVEALTAIAERDWARETLNRFSLLATAIADGSVNVTGDQKIRIFNGLQNTIGELTRADLPGASYLADKLNEQIGAIARLLLDTLDTDALAANSALRSSADLLRTTLVDNEQFFDRAWSGRGLNSQVVSYDHSDQGEMHYSVLYETGHVDLSDEVAINLGRTAAVTLIDPLEYISAEQVFEGLALLETTTTSVIPLDDVRTDSQNPMTNYSSSDLLRSRYTASPSSRDWESFLKFDLATFSQHVHDATVDIFTIDKIGNPEAGIHAVYRNDWSETVITWDWVENNFTPADDYGPTLDTLAPQSNQPAIWNVTEAIRKVLAHHFHSGRTYTYLTIHHDDDQSDHDGCL